MHLCDNCFAIRVVRRNHRNAMPARQLRYPRLKCTGKGAEETAGVSEEDQGCGGGGWADSCVRDRWAAVASALFDAARERCAVGAEAPTRASERLWSRYERKAARTHRGDEPDEDREYEATEALNAYVDSLAAMIDACPTAANLRRAQRAVREREIAPLRNFRP